MKNGLILNDSNVVIDLAILISVIGVNAVNDSVILIFVKGLNVVNGYVISIFVKDSNVVNDCVTLISAFHYQLSQIFGKLEMVYLIENEILSYFNEKLIIIYLPTQ